VDKRVKELAAKEGVEVGDHYKALTLFLDDVL
jgi:hypothetical protein